MRYVMRQKLLSWGDDFTIQNQGLRISLGRLGALGESGSQLRYSPAGRGSGAFCTLDRQGHPSSSGTSAP